MLFRSLHFKYVKSKQESLSTPFFVVTNDVFQCFFYSRSSGPVQKLFGAFRDNWWTFHLLAFWGKKGTGKNR